MKINDVELEFNCFEEQTIKRTEKALKHVVKVAEESERLKKSHETTALLCAGIKEAFDQIFGIGTGENVCGEENDLFKSTNAFTELINEKKKQEREMVQCAEHLKSLLTEE